MDEVQKELSLPFPELSGDLPLLPARMVNEYQYCPRLAYLEWVQGEWADSSEPSKAGSPIGGWTGRAAIFPTPRMPNSKSVYTRAPLRFPPIASESIGFSTARCRGLIEARILRG